MDDFFWAKVMTTIQYGWPAIIISILFAYINYKICKNRNYPTHKITRWTIAGFFFTSISTIILILFSELIDRPNKVGLYWDKSEHKY